jgi:hypothetical protein
VKVSQFCFKIMQTAIIIVVVLVILIRLTTEPGGTSPLIQWVSFASGIGAVALVIGMIANVWES